MESPGVLEFFAGRAVLVTGATGFMGKVLIEKLLRCCPDLGRVYIIVRPKGGVPARERVSVFKRISGNTDKLAKLCPLEGDMNAEDLGLSEQDKQKIFENVSVVFHMAASLNFKAPLKMAVEENTIGTQKILEFGCQMKNLVSFVYVSTAFCTCEQERAEERLYPPRVDPHLVMDMCRGLDDEALRLVTPRLLGSHPNVYTFSKHLAEALVAEFHARLPLSVARPSIVVPSLREPVPGWVDNMNGPTGLLIAAGKGLVHSIQLDPSVHMEIVPVDICINAIILAAHARPMLPEAQLRGGVPVYNISSNQMARWTIRELLDHSVNVMKDIPFQRVFWYPTIKARNNQLIHTLVVFFTQTIPAHVVDVIISLTGNQPFLVHVQRKISKEMEVLKYFRMREWDFSNERTWMLWPQLNQRDKEIFFINNALPVDRDKYIRDMMVGIRQYCCNEPLETLPQSKRLQRALFAAHRVCIIVCYVLCGWLCLAACGAASGFIRNLAADSS